MCDLRLAVNDPQGQSPPSIEVATLWEKDEGRGAYGAGQSAGETARIPIAIVFLLAGLWAIRKWRASR